ncbi:MAG: PAS domain-containing protein [Campylobacterota bacterium]
MNTLNLKQVKRGFLFLVFILISVATYYILDYQEKTMQSNKKLFYNSIFQEAQTHFEYFKVFRSWNSSYNGIYVKKSEDIKPNKYLKNNKLLTKDNETLIKINPAWMTRQISNLMNDVSQYNYKITSLKPLNPQNKAIGFEKEALKYLEKNKNKDYYTKIDEKNESLNFMGKLIVKESCLSCHASQGYKLGEIRGGIRVSVPLDIYKENIKVLEESHKFHVLLVLYFGLIIFTIIYYVVTKIYKNEIYLRDLKNEYKHLYDRYDYAVAGSKLGLWDWNLKTDEIYFSKIWKEMLGFKDDELPNEFSSWEQRLHLEDRQKAIMEIQANQNNETEFYENVYRLRHKDGSWVWILDKGKTIFDENGNPIRMLGFHANITKIQKLKEELSKLKLAIEHSPISIVITNKEGEIEYVNPHFSKISGYSFNEAKGENPRVLKSKFTSSHEYEELWKSLISKKTWQGTFKNITKEGKEFWETAIITPILDNNDNISHYLAIKQEITKEIYLKQELKNKEELMIAQSRHAAMGEMISMIAHQWRQPISVISMAANNILADIQLDMVDNDELRENTESMIQQTTYLSQTIEDFRDFFRPNKSKEITTPKKVLDESLKIMDKALENNDIEVELTKNENHEISIYSRELLQVFLNILKNAKEALQNNKKDNRVIKIEITKKDKVSRTIMKDNAGGIKNEILDKIFDPYFSTKNEKSGTGLGLYMCKTIIEKHFNGEIGVYNDKQGACFYIDIPLHEE